jgi:hypothetical protein
MVDTYHRITAPTVPYYSYPTWYFDVDWGDMSSSRLQPVDIGSPLRVRRAVYQLAQFFRREFEYDFVQYGYEGREEDESHRAFLWCSHREVDNCAVGACCFRVRDWMQEVGWKGWAMQWIWMHPYHRRQGLLTKSWPLFTKLFGKFDVEPPVSHAMEAFLQKHKWVRPFSTKEKQRWTFTNT